MQRVSLKQTVSLGEQPRKDGFPICYLEDGVTLSELRSALDNPQLIEVVPFNPQPPAVVHDTVTHVETGVSLSRIVSEALKSERKAIVADVIAAIAPLTNAAASTPPASAPEGPAKKDGAKKN